MARPHRGSPGAIAATGSCAESGRYEAEGRTHQQTDDQQEHFEISPFPRSAERHAALGAEEVSYQMWLRRAA